MKNCIRLCFIFFVIFLAVIFSLINVSPAVQAASMQSGTATPTPASSGADKLVIADVTTNCREGPGTAYRIVGWLIKGNSTEVYGRDEGRHWWYVHNPTQDGYCWVWAHSTYTDGNMGSVPLVSAPLAPKQKEDGQICALTICINGDNESIYCYCRPLQKSPPVITCYNYGCYNYPWWH